MANIWEKAIWILAGNLNFRQSYLITTVIKKVCTTSARRALRLSYHIWIFARFCLSTSPKQPTFGNCDLCDWIWHCYKLYKRRLNVLVMYFFYNFWSIHLSNHRIQVFIERVVNTSFINQSILFKLITLILKVNFN